MQIQCKKVTWQIAMYQPEQPGLIEYVIDRLILTLSHI